MHQALHALRDMDRKNIEVLLLVCARIISVNFHKKVYNELNLMKYENSHANQ